MAGNAFTNLNTISLSDNFRAWFDKTNEIVGALNPVEIYGITMGSGITVSVNAAGIATVGLSLASSVPGNASFTGSITFANEVRFGTGKTVDFHGATLYGNVVRSFNGKTGDVVVGLTGINDPTTAVGDLVIKTTGSTFTAYSLFNGDYVPTEGNKSIRFGASGGMLLGGSTSGTAGVHKFASAFSGTIQAAHDASTGSTTAYIHFKDHGYTGEDNAERGSQIFFGHVTDSVTAPVGLVIRGGGSTNGSDAYDNPMFVIDQTNRRIGVNGVTSGLGVLHVKTESTAATSANDILLENVGGGTAAIRTARSGSTGEYTALEGNAGTTLSPRFRGFQDKERLKVVLTDSMPVAGVELRHTTQVSTFTIQGQESSGASLSPVLTARQDGSFVVGGISLDDGSATGGSTFGDFNIATGKIRFGGTHGATLAETGGLITMLSKGGTVSYKNIFADGPDGGGSTSVVSNVSFSGNITDDMVLDLRQNVTGTQRLESLDETNTALESGNENAVYLEFIDFDSSGNKRYAVGNFDIQVTMPSYVFVNDFPAGSITGSDGGLRSVIGAIALVDDQKELNIPGDFALSSTQTKNGLLFSPSDGYKLLGTDDLVSTTPQRITFNLRGNCVSGVRVALIVSKTHAKLGSRNGSIYRGAGSYSAKFTNVE